MPKLKKGQPVRVYNKTMNPEGLEGTGVLLNYLKTEKAVAVGGDFDGKKVEFEQWRVRMDGSRQEKLRFFAVEGLPPSSMPVEEVKKLIIEQGLDVKTVIDAIIEINNLVPGSIICFGDELQNYCFSKAQPDRKETRA